MRILVALVVVFAVSSMKMAKILQEIEALLQPQAINWPFTLCGNGQWTIQSLTFDSIPARNANNDIIISGTANNHIDFQKAVLNMKLNGAFLHTENIDFKTSYDQDDSVSFKFGTYVPGFAPNGQYLSQVTFYDTANKPQGCIQFIFKL